MPGYNDNSLDNIIELGLQEFTALELLEKIDNLIIEAIDHVDDPYYSYAIDRLRDAQSGMYHLMNGLENPNQTIKKYEKK
jgi:hypothetical protein